MLIDIYLHAEGLINACQRSKGALNPPVFPTSTKAPVLVSIFKVDWQKSHRGLKACFFVGDCNIVGHSLKVQEEMIAASIVEGQVVGGERRLFKLDGERSLRLVFAVVQETHFVHRLQIHQQHFCYATQNRVQKVGAAGFSRKDHEAGVRKGPDIKFAAIILHHNLNRVGA